MSNFRLSRRAVIRGAGGLAIALPWLEIMGTEKRAHAAASIPAKRFLTVYTPGGMVGGVVGGVDPNAPDRFWPTAANPSSSPILAPLQPIEHKILVLKGLNMDCAIGEQHQAGIVGWLTGGEQGTAGQFPNYPSIDQVLATRFAQSAQRKFPGGLQMAVRWATGKSHGDLHAINAVNFEDNATADPIPPRLDPVEIWRDLFNGLAPGMADQEAARIARKKSILDFVDKKYVALGARLGASDKAKLDQHLTKIRELEMALDATVVGSDICKAPVQQDTTGYNPQAGVGADDADVDVEDLSTDEMIPQVGMYMMDMMVMAMACDMTAVGSFQWSDTEAKHTFPWLNLAQHHHFYQHDGGYKPVECEAIGHWYSQMHAYLLTEMDKVDMGGHTLLDESVVFFGSEISQPRDHRKDRMPFILAGQGGGLRPGRVQEYPGVSHNDLLVAILNLFGDTRQSYGDAQYNSGPLTGLT